MEEDYRGARRTGTLCAVALMAGALAKLAIAAPQADSVAPGAAAHTPSQAAAKPLPFDFSKVAISRTKLDDFPFFTFPDAVKQPYRRVRSSDFDVAWVVVGDSLQAFEGAVEEREFSYKDAALTRESARQRYQALMARLGATRVNTLMPRDPAFATIHGQDPGLRTGRLRMPAADAQYETYLIRGAAGKRIWIVLMFTERALKFLAVEEKALVQTVGFIKAR